MKTVKGERNKRTSAQEGRKEGRVIKGEEGMMKGRDERKEGGKEGMKEEE